MSGRFCGRPMITGHDGLENPANGLLRKGGSCTAAAQGEECPPYSTTNASIIPQANDLLRSVFALEFYHTKL